MITAAAWCAGGADLERAGHRRPDVPVGRRLRRNARVRPLNQLSPEPQINIFASVFCVGWRADFEFRGACEFKVPGDAGCLSAQRLAVSSAAVG